MSSHNTTSSVGKLPPFELERFFAKYEFTAPYIACASDMQAMSMAELLEMADDECRKLWDNLLLMYTETQGLPLLRQEIAKQLYPTLSSDEVVVMCPQEGIFLAMNAILAPCDHVIAVGPAYQSLTAVAESIGCEVSLWKCKPNETKRGKPLVFDVSDLEKLVKPNSKLLVVNFPHNPTGYLPTQDEWRRIVEFAKKHNLYLFSDEMYHGLESEPSLQLAPIATIYDKGISLSGVSKTYGMPGARIGWLGMKHKAVFQKIAIMKDYTTICNSAPSEILALIALRNHSKIIERNLAIIRRNTEAVQQFMNAHSGIFAFEAPVAGPIAFPKIISTDRANTAAYAQHLVDRFGILILPGEKYGDDHEYSSRFRLALGRTDIPEILKLWEQDFA